MKAVIYARFSSDRQREESIEGQVRECRAYAEQNGIQSLTPTSTGQNPPPKILRSGIVS